MALERRAFKSIQIDLEKKIYKLNGEAMKGISQINLEFYNGEWVLLVTKDVIYTQETPTGKVTERT